jgi:hypothetical protein
MVAQLVGYVHLVFFVVRRSPALEDDLLDIPHPPLGRRENANTLPNLVRLPVGMAMGEQTTDGHREGVLSRPRRTVRRAGLTFLKMMMDIGGQRPSIQGRIEALRRGIRVSRTT